MWLLVILGVFFTNKYCSQGVNSFLIQDSLQGVITPYGEVTGHQTKIQFDGKTYQVKKFLGIPYAEPPVGRLRFEKPVPITNLTTSFLANSFGPACPQAANGDSGFPTSEDCLYLNVFAPSSTRHGDAAKPVMLWIHCGGLVAGVSSFFDAEVLSAYTDVIVVTINYRLGPLGFFSTHDSNAKGNYGMWDQNLAIKWVHDNIRAFGGDSTNMTIFGESAGSSSVVYQMMYPGNKGLFKRAIAESGTIAAWGVTDKQTNFKGSMDFAANIGCNGTTNAQVVSCLRLKSSGDINEAVVNYMNKHPYDDINPTWAPVYDEDFVVADPLNMLAEVSNENTSSKYSHFHDTDLLIGVNNWDGSVYMNIWNFILSSPANLYRPSNISDNEVSSIEFETLLIPRAAKLALRQIPSLLVKKLITFEYIKWNNPTILDVSDVIQMLTDYVFNAPVSTTAYAHAQKNPNTYVYQFSTSQPKRLQPNSAHHGDDLSFVFGFVPSIRALLNYSMADVTPDMIQVSKAIMTMWTNFARSGNPNKPLSVRPEFNSEWPAYGDSQSYLEITPQMTQASVKTRLAARAVEFWNVLLPRMQSLSSL